MSAPDMERLTLCMSNFDHSIDPGLEDALTQRPGKVCAGYAGWNFFAYVWFADNLFHAEVWTHGSPREIVSRDSLEDIMSSVSNTYGWD